MVDDHEFFGPEQIMRYHQGAQRVIRDDSAGIANDMGISLLQSQRASRKAGVHASEDGELALRPRREPAQFMGARVNFIGGEDFVDDAHGKKSLAKRKEARTQYRQRRGTPLVATFRWLTNRAHYFRAEIRWP